jgi:hypothetical protein
MPFASGSRVAGQALSDATGGSRHLTPCSPDLPPFLLGCTGRWRTGRRLNVHEPLLADLTFRAPNRDEEWIIARERPNVQVRSGREQHHHLRGDFWYHRLGNRRVRDHEYEHLGGSGHCLVHENFGQMSFNDVPATCDNARNRVHEVLRQRTLWCPDDARSCSQTHRFRF